MKFTPFPPLSYSTVILYQIIFVFALFGLTSCSNSGTSDSGTNSNQTTISDIPSINITDASITEGNSGTININFIVSLSSATTETVTVNFTTAGNTATVADNDYIAANGILTFNPNSTSQLITIAVQGDTRVEPDELFNVNLSNPSNATLADASAIGTIINDDVTAPIIPSISIADVSVAEGDSGTVNAAFTVSLSSATTETVTVNFITAGNTATVADNDYIAANGILTFNPNSTSQLITVAVQGDTRIEPNEFFNVNLSNPSNATLADASAVGTIINDDTAPIIPSISIADVSVTEGDSGTVNAAFTVSLSSATTETVTVNFTTAGNTATVADNDYSAASGTLTFNPNSTSQLITIAVQGDTRVEPNETFFVNLSDPSNATLADSSAVGTIINDDVAAPVIPSISIADISVTEGDSGTVNAVFTVSLSSATTETVTVNFTTAGNTATVADNDYSAASGTLTFSPNSTSQLITIAVRGDTRVEPDETFFVNLSNPSNATISDTQALGTILNDDTPQSGLDTRPSNTTCLALDRPQTGASIQLDRVFPNLSFSLPTVLLQAPGDSSRWFVAEKGGRVLSFDNTPNTSTTRVFIDIRSSVDSGPNEAGLLGIAFDPDFATNGHVYLSYTVTGLTSRIARYTSIDNGQTLDAASAQVILDVPQPYGNHNGGYIAFGPGPSSGKYLYIGFGDGGDAGDPLGHGQNTQTLLGAMLRINVDVSQTDWNAGARYYIPADNPFAASASCSDSGCPEIYAWGLRNPWRWSFDRDNNDLWLGDVGQDGWEEINRVVPGGNYGWNIREGAHCYNGSSCNSNGLIDPVAEYDHSQGSFSVTGGYVYRGTTNPGLQGTYLYGDFGSGTIWGLDTSQPNPAPQTLLDSSYNIASFAEGNDGELYVLNYGTSGTIFRIATAVASGDPFPAQLSATGCVEAANPTQPAAGLIPYDINAPFWSDGAVKQRYLSLPDANTIHIDSANDWDFPIGSVLLKNFSLNNTLIETRLLMRHSDGAWGGYSYEWDNGQNDATLVLGGKTRVIGTQNWLYPSTNQCTQCHTQVGGGPLGPETAQMNRNFTFPSTARTANQLYTYEQIGMFDMLLSDTPENLPALADPADSGADLHARARAYLHTNCAQCHQPGGPTPASINLLYGTADTQMNICHVIPENGDLGITNARIVTPGDPAKSILLERMKRRDIYAMPPLGSFLVDSDGAALLEAWIISMNGSCP